MNNQQLLRKTTNVNHVKFLVLISIRKPRFPNKSFQIEFPASDMQIRVQLVRDSAKTNSRSIVTFFPQLRLQVQDWWGAVNTAERRLHAGAVMERASEKDNKRSLKSSLMQCEIKESSKRERRKKILQIHLSSIGDLDFCFHYGIDDADGRIKKFALGQVGVKLRS